jgi:hypothetical protein
VDQEPALDLGSQDPVLRGQIFVFQSLDFCSGTTVLANLSHDKRDVVLLFAWIEHANVSDNRVN